MAKIASMAKKSGDTKSYGASGRASSENQEIERLAYQFFVERSYQHGYDKEDWLRAEAIVKSRRS